MMRSVQKLVPLTSPRRPLALVGALMLFAATSLHAQQRTVSGTVTDGHEPLRHVVVQLKNPATNAVTSALTGDDGRYIFKHLDSHTDLLLSAAFRGHQSHVHSISMFDSHLEETINLKIRLDK